MINCQLDILQQAKTYLSEISVEHYTAIISPNFISSSGSHIRHIIDHYLAIISSIESNCINYDVRQRHSDLEKDPQRAYEQINKISKWLMSLNDEQLNRKVMLSTEISITSQKIQKVPTNIARELIFASSHAVHHYAMVAQISLAQNNKLDDSFGLAPATASFMRKSA